MNPNSSSPAPSPADRIENCSVKLSTLIDALDRPSLLVDHHGIITYANRSFLDWAGVPLSQLLTQDWFETYLPQSYRAPLRNEFLQAGNSGISSLGSIAADNFSPPKDDQFFLWKTTIVRPQPDTSLLVMIASLENVTLECQTAQLLRENTRRLEQAESIARLGHWELDLLTQKLYWSDEVYRIFESSRADFDPSCHRWHQFVHPDDSELLKQMFAESLRTHLPYEFSHRLVMPDGRIKFVHERCRTTYAPDGTPLKSFGTVQDMTEEKRNEEQLHLKTHAIESAATAIAFADLKGNLTYVNPAFVSKWGYDHPDDLLGRNALDLYENPADAREALAETLLNKKFRGDLLAKRRDGLTFIADTCADLIHDAHEHPQHLVGWITDVTDKRAAAAALAREQQLSTTVIETSPVCIKLIDQAGRFLTINAAGVRMLGAEQAQEIIGRRVWDLIDPNDRESLTHLQKEVWEGRSGQGLFHVHSLHGEKFVVQSHFSPLRDDNGQVIAILSICMDITQQQNDARRLQESQEKLETILAQLPVTMFSYDMDGVIQMVEGLTLQNLGFKPVEILQKKVFDVYQSQRHIIEAIRGALDGKSTTTLCEHHNCTFEVRQTPMRDVTGRQTGVIALVIDITEQAQAARQLSDTTVHLKTMFDAISEGVIVLDREGLITDMNPSAERIFGVKRETLLGRHAFAPKVNRIHEDGSLFEIAEFPADITLNTGLPQRETVMGIDLPERGRIWISINTEPMIRPEDSEPFAIVVSFTDITLRKELAERERDIREKLTHALRINMLGEMSAGLAHELNQPLTAIASYAFVAEGTLARPSLSLTTIHEIRGLLGKITDESVRAGEIIKRLRNLVRNRQSKAVPCVLKQLVDEVLSLIDYEVRSLGLLMTCDANLGHACVLADPVQTQQVLMNLFRNAIDSLKSSATQSPQISISAAVSPDNSEELIITVTDNGPGIPSELTTKVFEPYLSTKREGLGLGLPISRTIVEAQGGKLDLVLSRPGKTVFEFSLQICSPT